MNYLNSIFKLEKFYSKSKKKYEKIIKNSKDKFPSFLSTKHFYKRRKAFFINSTPNAVKKLKLNSERKKETNLKLYNLTNKKKSIESYNSTNKLTDSFSSNNLYFESENNIKNKTKKKSKRNKKILNSEENEKIKRILSAKDIKKLKSILDGFHHNKLATKNLCKQEKKLSLNSLTETNFLFLFSSYKNKNSHQKKMKHLLYNRTAINNMTKSTKVSFNLMKKFNNKTKRILEEEKSGGIQYSHNVNEFRKQIINSYKDKLDETYIKYDKTNYNNAIQLLSSNQEKQIKKALELEKEFYKNKYKENFTKFDNIGYLDDHTKRKSKKTLTTKYNFNSTSSKNDKNLIRLSKDKEINNTKEEEKIFEYKHVNREIRSNSNNNKVNLLNQYQKSSMESNSSHNNKNSGYNNNIFLKYMNNIKQRRNFVNNSNSTSKEYNKFVRESIKERAKQFADSMASINNYFEYQPLKNINSVMPHLNINTSNLKRVIKVNEINKNLFSYDDDDLLLHNIKKLKEELRDVELQYYSIEKYNQKYHLSFVKNNIKRKTLEKINNMKNPRFGIPV